MEIHKAMNNQCVYMHLTPDDNKVFYIGMGNNKRPFDFRPRNKYWNDVVNKCGKPNVSIVAKQLSVTQAADIERFWIKHHGLNRLTNISPGGDGIFGTVHSEEHKRKIGLIHKGKKLPFEQKQKLSELYKGRKFKEETLKKIGDANSSKIQYIFTHVEHGIIQCTARELYTKFKLSNSHLWSVIQGKRKNHKGWSMYAN